MRTGSGTTIVPRHVPGWELLQPAGAAVAGTERGRALAAAAHSSGMGGKGLEKQIAPALGWEQAAGQGEEGEEGFRGRETVLFENLLKNAIQEAILNTYICLNATATFPLIYYESPK